MKCHAVAACDGHDNWSGIYDSVKTRVYLTLTKRLILDHTGIYELTAPPLYLILVLLSRQGLLFAQRRHSDHEDALSAANNRPLYQRQQQLRLVSRLNWG